MSLEESYLNTESDIVEEDDDIDDIEEDSYDLNTHFHTNIILSNDNIYKKYYNQKKITYPYITKYEKAKIIGTRSQMISSGSPVMINIPKHITNSVDIAELEYKQKKIPLIIRRTLQNNEFEDWRLEDLIL